MDVKTNGFGLLGLLIALVIVAAFGFYLVPRMTSLMEGSQEKGSSLLNEAREVTKATNEAAQKAEAQLQKFKCEIESSPGCSK